jgi:N-acetylglucosaminyldiphosphoundecaprenol N-acetyl-beta-D-mannosaminyltransferase
MTEWPKKVDLFGVGVSETTYHQAADLIMGAALRRESATVTHCSVHGVVMATRDPVYREMLNALDLVAPDGQPVRWAVNRFYGLNLPDRVYGPELMSRLCRRAGQAGVSVYLYGSSPEVLAKLRETLSNRIPRLRIAGSESPPFRPLTAGEMEDAVRRINDSGAGLVFIGLGCPRQDIFAYEHREAIHAVQLCVGAAFDFIAGNKRMAPRWMQKRGLEWLFRLTQEPRRLYRRYFYVNTVFSLLVLRQLLRRKRESGRKIVLNSNQTLG